MIDPESGYDRVADVGIDGGTIAAVTERTPEGHDARSTPAARSWRPGSSTSSPTSPTTTAPRYKIARRRHHQPRHARHQRRRARLLRRVHRQLPGQLRRRVRRPVDAVQRARARRRARQPSADQIGAAGRRWPAQQLAEGWIGVDFEPEYTPGTTFEEMLAMAEVAAEFGVPCFFHGRYSAVGTNAADPRRDHRDRQGDRARRSTSSTSSAPAAPSTWRRRSPGSRRPATEGLDVTACMYPYDFWATYLGSTRFADGLAGAVPHLLRATCRWPAPTSG